MGKYVDKRLEELGGERVFELGLGDDDGKYVETLNKLHIYKSLKKEGKLYHFGLSYSGVRKVWESRI